jgi:uncharacterized membrane protein
MLIRTFTTVFTIVGCVTMLSLYKEFYQWNPETVEDPVENIDTIVAVEDIDKTIEVKSMSLQWRSLIDGEKNFWQVLAISLLFLVLNALVMLQLLRRYWHRKDDIEQERKEKEIIKERFERLAQELRVTKELMEEAQEKDCTEIWNGTQSVKKEIRKEEAFLTDFQSVMGVVKMTNFGDGNRGTLQNLSDALEKNSMEGNESLDEIENVIKEMRIDMEKCSQMPNDQIGVSPEPKEEEMITDMISYTAASKAVASEEPRRKRNLRVSKIPIRAY